jgi:ribosome maturation factor RimP
MTRPNEAQPDARLPAIRAVVEPVLAAHAVELCDLAWTSAGSGGGLTLRVTIERPGPEGEVWQPEKGFGVTLDDCADVSRALSAALDADDTIDHHYTLEVSSPGLDRPIRGARDFARFRGALAKVKLSRPAPDGQRVLRGSLLEAGAGLVAVEVDGKRIEVPEADVAEANLVFEMGADSRKGTGPRKGNGPRSAGSRGAAPKGRAPKGGAPKGGAPKGSAPKGGAAFKPGTRKAAPIGDGGHAPPKRPPASGRGGAAR